MISSPAATLIGRAAIVADLADRCSRPAPGASTILLEGVEGVGKSMVLEAVLAHMADLSTGRAPAFGKPGITPVHRTDVSKVVAELPRDEHAPFPLLEQWGVEMPAVGGVTTATRLLRSAWLEGERSREFAGEHTLVVVEDAHNASRDELAAVQAAILRFPRVVTLLLVARPEPRIELPDSERVVLTGLRRADSARLLRTAVPSITDQAAAAAYELTDGVPGDLLDLVRETPRAFWYERRPLLPVTTRYRAGVDKTLDALPWAGQTLAAALAVLNTPADLSTATRLTERLLVTEAGHQEEPAAGETPAKQTDPDSESDLEDAALAAVETLVRAGLVVWSGQGIRARIRWSHPMTPAAVRARLGPVTLRRYHEVAIELADTEGEQLFHRMAAAHGVDDQLAEELAAYAATRAGAGAHTEAARVYLDAHALAGSQERRVQYLIDGIDAHIGGGSLAEAEHLLPELEVLPRTARVEATMGYLAIVRGRPDEAEAYLTRAWELAGRDPRDQALISARRTLHHLAKADAPGIIAWADIAIDKAPGTTAATEAAAIRGLGLGGSGRGEEARAQYEELSARRLSTAQGQRVAMGHGWLETVLDSPFSARTLLERAVPTDVTHGATRISLWAQCWLARSLVVLGDWDSALEVAERAAELALASGHEVIRPLAHWPAAHVYALRGDHDNAHHHLRAGTAPDYAYPIMRLPAATARAQVAEIEADYETALATLAPFAAIYANPERDTGFWPWRNIYANALVMLGRLDEAEAFVTPHLQVSRRWGRPADVARAEHTMGRIHGARGEVEAAEAAFERAAAQINDLPMPLEHARTRFARGQTLRRLGRRREAERELRAAREQFVALGAAAYVARSDRELKASGQERSGGPTSLTPQETSVLDLVASGLTNKETAQELFISVKTVQYHLTRIYAKLGVRSRSELAAKYGPASETGTT